MINHHFLSPPSTNSERVPSLNICHRNSQFPRKTSPNAMELAAGQRKDRKIDLAHQSPLECPVMVHLQVVKTNLKVKFGASGGPLAPRGAPWLSQQTYAWLSLPRGRVVDGFKLLYCICHKQTITRPHLGLSWRGAAGAKAGRILWIHTHSLLLEPIGKSIARPCPIIDF